MKLSCHLNLAAAKLQLEEYEEVLTQCRLALVVDSEKIKALYRRGLAHLALDEFPKA